MRLLLVRGVPVAVVAVGWWVVLIGVVRVGVRALRGGMEVWRLWAGVLVLVG